MKIAEGCLLTVFGVLLVLLVIGLSIYGLHGLQDLEAQKQARIAEQANVVNAQASLVLAQAQAYDMTAKTQAYSWQAKENRTEGITSLVLAIIALLVSVCNSLAVAYAFGRGYHVRSES